MGVVPPASALPLSGSQNSGEPPLFFTVGTGTEKDLDNTEVGFREDMIKLFQSEQLTGAGQQGKAPVRHSRGVD